MTVLTVALIDNLTHGMIICVSLLQPSECGRATSVHRPLDQGFLYLYHKLSVSFP